jgi:hypothetical protein
MWPSPLASAPILPMSRSCSATSGSSRLRSVATSSSAVGGRSAAWEAWASFFCSTLDVMYLPGDVRASYGPSRQGGCRVATVPSR